MGEQTPLRRLQLVEFDMLRRLADACEKNGLRYYILGGTLLGAVRHGGFIPWDDDIDVGLPRPDYERLIELSRQNPELLQGPEDGDVVVRITNFEDDVTSRHGMAKLTSSAIHIINRSANEERFEGAWIDVIPLDGYPGGAVKGALHKAHLMWWKVMDATAEFDYAVDVKRDRGFAGNVALKVLSAFCHTIRPYGDDYHKVLMKTNDVLKRYRYDDEEKVINLFAALGFREIFYRADLGQGQPILFEGETFMAPDNIPAILTAIYGPDYMTPPPEKDRNVHNAEIVE